MWYSLIEKPKKNRFRLCGRLVKGGELEMLKWARGNGAPWNEFTCAFAARGGHLEVLKWARGNGAP